MKKEKRKRLKKGVHEKKIKREKNGRNKKQGGQ